MEGVIIRRELDPPDRLRNALFAGHEIGSENGATLASFVVTCKTSDVNPIDDIVRTLRTILGGHPGNRIEAVVPCCFDRPSSLAA